MDSMMLAGQEHIGRQQCEEYPRQGTACAVGRRLGFREFKEHNANTVSRRAWSEWRH